jgi:hypothetical protein
VIVLVTSRGDAICRVNDMTQRTEIASVLDFLTEFGRRRPEPATYRGGRLPIPSSR